jgi:hypothetical protein
MPEFKAATAIPQPVSQDLQLPDAFPRLPDSVRERFGGIEEYEENLKKFWTRTRRVLSETYFDIAQPVNAIKADTRNIRKEFVSADAALTAEFSETITVLISADEALAARTTNLEVSVNTPVTGLLARMTIEESVRATQTAALALRTTDLEVSINTAGTGLLARVFMIESAYVDATEAAAISSSEISASIASTAGGTIGASILAESVARATATGHLSGKHTLKVIAGNVVTGMNITSDSGGGSDISEITFHTDNLKIISSALTKRNLLNASAAGFIFGADLLSDNFVTGTSGWKLTRDTGIFECTDGIFRGSITSVSGTIGGLTIGATKLSSGDVEIGSSWTDGIKIGSSQFAHIRRFPISALPTYDLMNGSTVVGQFAMVDVAGSYRSQLSATFANFTGSVTANAVSATSFNATP